MGKLMDFLLEDDLPGRAELEVDIPGFPHPFLVRSVTEAENKALRRGCQKVTFDKLTQQRCVETDQDLYNNRLVAACCAEPNFKDARLQAKWGVRGAEDLIDALLKPGQFVQLLLAVQQVNGFSTGMDELRDRAKN